MSSLTEKSLFASSVWSSGCWALAFPLLQISLLILLFNCNPLSAGDCKPILLEPCKTVKTESANNAGGNQYADIEENLPTEVLPGSGIRLFHVYNNGSSNRWQIRKVHETFILACLCFILPKKPELISPIEEYPTSQYSDLIRKIIPVRAGPLS